MKARFRSLAIAIVVLLLQQATYALGGSCKSERFQVTGEEESFLLDMMLSSDLPAKLALIFRHGRVRWNHREATVKGEGAPCGARG